MRCCSFIFIVLIVTALYAAIVLKIKLKKKTTKFAKNNW